MNPKAPAIVAYQIALALMEHSAHEIALDTTTLITVTGQDRPGVTSTLLHAVAATGMVVLDIEQVVIRGKLTLGILLDKPSCTPGERPQLEQAIQRAAESLDLSCTISHGVEDTCHALTSPLLVTVIGHPLSSDSLARVAEAVADADANIDRIVRVSHYPVTALELEISGSERNELRQRLTSVALATGVDLAVQDANLMRRSRKLVVMDVDSTFIREEVIELIAAHAGCESQVEEITTRAMRGEIDFAESLEQRVALLAGLPVAALDEVRSAINLTPGARTLVTTLQQLGYEIALVSGGFHEIVDTVAAELGINHVRANRLEVANGLLTGKTTGPVVDRPGKAQALREIAAEINIPIENTIAIGDGANDLDMLSLAGLGIAFNAKPIVREQADTSVNVPYLDSVLFLLGIPHSEISNVG